MGQRETSGHHCQARFGKTTELRSKGIALSRLLTRTIVILEDLRQDPPFATTNMEEEILGPAVCFPVP